MGAACWNEQVENKSEEAFFFFYMAHNQLVGFIATGDWTGRLYSQVQKGTRRIVDRWIHGG